MFLINEEAFIIYISNMSNYKLNSEDLLIRIWMISS